MGSRKNNFIPPSGTPHYQDKLKEWIENDNSGGQMVFRIGYPRDKVLKAPRWPLDWVLIAS